ncbi:MAG TPA: hypothetical protein VF712_00015 [Thermoleophilaceae bacterium]|jgi:hypothetical protein
MSTATRPEESRPAPPSPDQPHRSSTLGQLIAAVLLAGTLAIAAIALWPESEADKARDDGERLGEAVGQLYYADSSSEVDAALAEVHDAAAESADHAGDAVAEQVAAQEDALERAADGFAGAATTSDDFERDAYEAELDYAIDDLESNAAEFQENAPEVRDAFWQGVEDGLPDELD